MDDEDYGEDADFSALAGPSAVSSSTPRRSGPATVNGEAKVVQPKPQALASRQGPSSILVSTRQKGNPILNHIRSLPWEYSDTPADYVLGATTCGLFLSLKYHRLHPEYIYGRIRALGKMYNLRVLLTMVDITNHEEALRELSKTSMINNFTLILCWSAQEAGRYLELFKSYEHASPASIRAHQAESYRESLTEFITTPRSINKTDAASLISNYGTLRAAVNAPPEELALIPGWGEKKVRDWCNAMQEPFRARRAARMNTTLMRSESQFSRTDSGDQGTAIGAEMPIPISTIPVRRNEPIPDKQAIETQQVAPTGHDEGSAVMPAEAETSVAQQEGVRSNKASGQETLSEGVAAALARLRGSP